ncbi:uncharacterized PPE family protein PPE16-like [Achroia grisella]|uniref:uncharacterized PPE family protein PPE16-like n=1 Tax=Achroia grisella TaxID=688607 RepID=UPI0027D2C77B|nr:uncharacterized PPE family protein PPE16-like [Achroia grisella]
MVHLRVTFVCVLSLLLKHGFSAPIQGNLQSFNSGVPLNFPNGIGNLGGGFIGSNNLGSSAISEAVASSSAASNLGFNNEALIGNGYLNNLGHLNIGSIGSGFGNLGLNNEAIIGSNFGSLANSAQSAVLTGTVAQTVASGPLANIAGNTQLAPMVTEIVPSLQFGELSLDGALPVGGTIKVSGTFPVYGMIGVDGSIPSHGTAFIDTGNGLIPQDLCQCNLA